MDVFDRNAFWNRVFDELLRIFDVKLGRSRNIAEGVLRGVEGDGDAIVIFGNRFDICRKELALPRENYLARNLPFQIIPLSFLEGKLCRTVAERFDLEGIDAPTADGIHIGLHVADSYACVQRNAKIRDGERRCVVFGFGELGRLDLCFHRIHIDMDKVFCGRKHNMGFDLRFLHSNVKTRAFYPDRIPPVVQKTARRMPLEVDLDDPVGVGSVQI